MRLSASMAYKQNERKWLMWIENTIKRYYRSLIRTFKSWLLPLSSPWFCFSFYHLLLSGVVFSLFFRFLFSFYLLSFSMMFTWFKLTFFFYEFFYFLFFLSKCPRNFPYLHSLQYFEFIFLTLSIYAFPFSHTQKMFVSIFPSLEDFLSHFPTLIRYLFIFSHFQQIFVSIMPLLPDLPISADVHFHF